MSGYLRRLATTGAAYTAASIISKLIAVALLPLYTRHLSTDDYGAAEILFAGVVTASIVVRLGLIEAVLRFYYREDEDLRTGSSPPPSPAPSAPRRSGRSSSCPSPNCWRNCCSIPTMRPNCTPAPN